MVSKNQLKLIKSLQQKKYRNEHGLFFVEGFKTVNELLNSNLKLFKLLATKEFVGKFLEAEIEEIKEADLKKISALQNPSGVIAIFKIPKPLPVSLNDWIVVLDDIRDPGNLGTIIRLCDWFGIKNLVCSKTTVDCYNPKVLQATMGSIARVNVVYQELKSYLEQTTMPIYGTFMDGDSIYQKDFPQAGILILGNEANGISDEIKSSIESRVTIPRFGQQTTESLNVATAAAIVLSEIRSKS
jgi:TrmH family RNA methyltransferase